MPGFTVVSENPVYVARRLEHRKARPRETPTDMSATAVIGDAATLLSNAWTDDERVQKIRYERDRNALRADELLPCWAMIARQRRTAFPFPNAGGHGQRDFGTDGGAHNFLRYLENWQSPLR